MKSKKTKFDKFKVQLLVLTLLTALIVPIVSVLAQQEEPNQTDSQRLAGDRQNALDDRLRTLPDDVTDALGRLPKDIEVNSFGPDRLPTMISAENFGIVPEKLINPRSGTIEKSDEIALDETIRNSVLTEVAAVFRLTPDELKLQTVRHIKSTEENFGAAKGDSTIVRYRQIKNGLEVIGGDLTVIINGEGRVKVVTSTARGGQTVSSEPAIAKDAARENTLRYAAETYPQAKINGINEGSLVYILTTKDYSLHLAYAFEVNGLKDNEPFADIVFTDAVSNQVVDVHPQVQPALNRRIYTANNTFTLPGTARRFEGQAPNADPVVNTNYDFFGITYSWYQNLFGRDSFNNGGAIITSSVHVGNSYVNAYWNGSQFAFGDGDGFNSSNLANALDVTAHEYTHAVTQYSSNLAYQNESGALNEGWSDIFGAVVEARQTLGATGFNSNTWKIGEDVWTPGTAGDALRYMDDPVRDGSSRDYYPLRYTGTADNGGVHYNSGIANLAFKLTVTGGMHPRGRNNVQVSGIGIDKARRIYYRAGVVYLNSNSNFEAARAATAQAATDLFGRCNAEYVAVQRAWDAVAVPGTWDCSGGGGGDIHYQTYGNGNYDWHGTGCYDVAQSYNTGTSNIRIQADAVPFSPNPAASVARRIAFNFPDTSRPFIIMLNWNAPYLQIKTPVGGADSHVYISGDVNTSATIFFYSNSSNSLLGTIVVNRQSNGVYQYVARYANGSVLRAYTTPNVVINSYLQAGWNVNLRGLAGVYPVEPNLLSRSGQAYSISTLRSNITALNQFATSWACPAGQSLFDAPSGFTEQPFIPEINSATQTEAEQMCEEAGVPRSDVDGFEGCVFDVVNGGDELGAIMATHAGTVYTLQTQSPPEPEPDPCNPSPSPTPVPSVSPTDTPFPDTTPQPTDTIAAVPSSTPRTTATVSPKVICTAQTDIETMPADSALRNLFINDSSGGDLKNTLQTGVTAGLKLNR